MFRLSFIITCVAVSLASCGGGGSGAAVAAPVSDLGDVCLANESYYPLTSSADEEFRLRKPQPGDNFRVTSEIEARTSSETVNEESDETSTWYSVNSPSDVVPSVCPPTERCGAYSDWGDNLLRVISESNIGGESSSSVSHFPSNGGTRDTVVNSSGEFLAQSYEQEDGEEGFAWGKDSVPIMNEFTSYSFDYLVFSSDFSSVKVGKSTMAIDTKRRIKTGIGCVEAFKYTESTTQLVVGYTTEPEKISGVVTNYAHPILGNIKSEVAVQVYNYENDVSPSGEGEGVYLLMDTNLTNLLPAKTN